jgi:hypothetical protein
MLDFDTTGSRQTQIDKALEEIESLAAEKHRQREFVNQQTAKFISHLFEALSEVVLEARGRGVADLGEPRMIDHPAGGGRRALQIPIEDWSVIFVPLVGMARPNVRDEAQIPGVFFKQSCGRVAVFIGSDQDTASFYDFLVLPNGAWFAWGYGWPRQASTIEETDFKLLALGLIGSFMKDIFVTWRTREETTLGSAMDARRRAYVFGLPGDEA